MEKRQRRWVAFALVLAAFVAVVGLAPKPAWAANKTVENAEELTEAAAAATEGDTITLGSSFDITKVTFNVGVTLDLGGNELRVVQATGSQSDHGLEFAGGSSVLCNGTITDMRSHGNDTCGYVAVYVTGSDTALVTEDLAVRSYEPNNTTNYNYMLRAVAGSSLTLNSGTKVSELDQEGLTWGESTYGTAGVTVLGPVGASAETIDDATATKLTVNEGASITTSSFAISGNGTSHNTIITINGGEIVSTEAQGVYHPQYGSMAVNGGSVEGETGIEIRSGVLEVNGGFVTGTGTPVVVEPNGNGSTSSGAGIAVAQHTTKLPIKVEVVSGTISGFSALYESNPQGNGDDSLAKIDLGISGGTLEAINGGTNPVASDNKSNFVSGGSFSAPLSSKYIAGDLVNLKDNVAEDAPYTLTTKEVAASAAAATVTAGGQTVYFVNATDAQDFAEASGNAEVEVTSYTVTLNPGYAGAEATKVTVNKNDAAVQPADPARQGYEFLGWLDASGKPYDFATPVTSDVTLTGSWSLLAPELTVSADTEGFRQGATATVSVAAESDAKVEYTYQWYGYNGAIAGATDASLEVLDQGDYWVVVTATDADGLTAEVTSNPAFVGYESYAMYRLYNPNSGEHFYTASTFERDVLNNIGWNYEGVGWYAPYYSGTPVYRLYNPNAGDHHYTMSVYERDSLIEAGWNYEGVGWSSADAETGVPLLREYNPNATTGTHNYTTSQFEHDSLIDAGWNDEGIAWYAVK